ncbi:MAG: hypothetical protein FWG53_01790 [Clostridiales bacterium]|nr:hypothetical protein [Clostridiales bacterium]
MPTREPLHCGVRFCGGCNPRYERIKALEELKSRLNGKASFSFAEEGASYDVLLVIGGCPNCCASYEQYEAVRGAIKVWDESHIEGASSKIEILLMEDETSGLEKNL